MNFSKDQIELENLKKQASLKYGKTADQLTLDNVAYSTMLYAMIRFIESYKDVYIQNKKEIAILTDKVIQEVSADPNLQKASKIQLKSKTNKLINFDQSFQKFIKLFKKEFAANLKNEDLEEDLLDALDDFWKKTVSFKDGKIWLTTKM